MKKCRITVLRKTEYRDLMERYENPLEHTCGLKEGDTFIVCDLEKPSGMCEGAWLNLYPFVMTLSCGGKNIYDGWMKNENTAIISCNDGIRPVSFLIEVIEEC